MVEASTSLHNFISVMCIVTMALTYNAGCGDVVSSDTTLHNQHRPGTSDPGTSMGVDGSSWVYLFCLLNLATAWTVYKEESINVDGDKEEVMYSSRGVYVDESICFPDNERLWTDLPDSLRLIDSKFKFKTIQIKKTLLSV